MLQATLFAITWDEMFRPDRLLAVVVATVAGIICAILGGLLFGILAQLLTRVLTMKRTPRYLVIIMRLVGAGLCGILIFLYVMLFFGGPGSGGPGGMGLGPGMGLGSGNKQDEGKNDTDASKKNANKGNGQETPSVAYVEVLLDDEIEKIAGPGAVQARKYYRLEGSPKSDLLTLPELRERIRTRPNPVRLIYIVLGPDRSDRDVPRVFDLRAWATGEKIDVDYNLPE